MTTRISIDERGVMVNSEGRVVMDNSRAILPRYWAVADLARGEVCEVGFGIGLLHARLSCPHTVVEITDQGCPRCRTVRMDATVGLPDGQYDTIIWDVHDGNSDLWPGTAFFKPWLATNGRIIRVNIDGPLEVYV